MIKIGSDGLPVTGKYSKDISLAGFICNSGTRFTNELSEVISILIDLTNRNSCTLLQFGYNGEIDFIVRELGVRCEQIDDVELGKISLFWIHPLMLKRLKEDCLRKFDEILARHKNYETSNLNDLQGKNLQQCSDIISKDLKLGDGQYKGLSARDLISIFDKLITFEPEIQKFIPHNFIENFDLDEYESSIFEKYRRSRFSSFDGSMNEDDYQVIKEVAERVSEDIGYLEVTTYNFNSVFGNFQIIVHKLFNLSEKEEIVESFTPYQIRDGGYRKYKQRLTSSYFFLE